MRRVSEGRPLGTDDTLAGTVERFTEAGLDAPSVVAGRYQIIGLLGSGGMGSVYRARDLELDEIVALKLLRRELLAAPGMIGRFRQEVKLARRVTHTNVARVFDIGEDGADKFLTMEYVEGEPLSTAIARRGALPLDEVRTLARTLCHGLMAAHSAGVVHRDLKPDNILLGKSGRIVITDFGIARLYQQGLQNGGAGHTQGGMLGTPTYMAPEQVEGLTDVDERADVYALGAVLFELITGERAWRGDAMLAVAAARLMQPPPDPRMRRAGVPDALAEVILRWRARRREDRFASAMELAAALEGAFDAISRWTPLPPELEQATLPSRADKSVAVLPFRNSGPPEDEYVAEGLTEDLIDTLSMTRRLRVRPHSVVANAQHKETDPRAIGRALEVQVVIEGSLRRVGERTRVSARAISVSDGFQIWAHRFDAAPGDLLVVSDQMAHAIAAALTLEPGGAAREGPSNPAAVELYLRARRELRKTWNGDPGLAVELFGKAVALAPDDTNIIANHALALARAAFRFGGSKGIEAARVATERAVAVAPDLGESWAALYNVRMCRHEPVPAAEAIAAGLRRSPTSGRLHAIAGQLQLEVGLIDEAQAHFEAALRLDSSLSEANWDLARLFAVRGEWDRADALLEQRTDDDSAYLGRTITRTRLALWRNHAIELPDDLELRADASILAIKLLHLGQRAQAAGVATDEIGNFVATLTSPDRPRLSSFLWQVQAELVGALGDSGRAQLGIEGALACGLSDVVWITRCPALEVVRNDAAYPTLLARIEANAAPIRALLSGV